MPERTQRQAAMNAMQSTTDETIIKAALAMLRIGIATQAEVAELAGTSRQLVRHWATRAGIDAPAARAEYLKREWQKRQERPSK
jgi:hypothetical protein